ncbi:MAG: energy-coupling factor transporter transmembrane protein EcfT [Lachnospiraceae bacterium]|nr:energy-coupling factor transporter transmembrane protein EcfT [Lachnospiraceae bacterium]
MKESDRYVPPKDGGTFAVKTIKTIGDIMSRVKVQRGHEKKHCLPAELKLMILLVLLVLTSVTQNGLVLMGIAAVVLFYLSTWPARDLWGIIKTSLSAMALSFVILLPAMIMNPAGIPNNLVLMTKVFFCVSMVGIFNHTSQWNHVTGALAFFHIPGIFIFTLDMTLKYMVLLGNLIRDLLTSMTLRAVGRHDRKYASVGGVMGVTFIRGTEMNTRMYEAMKCRGFTGDYGKL